MNKQKVQELKVKLFKLAREKGWSEKQFLRAFRELKKMYREATPEQRERMGL